MKERRVERKAKVLMTTSEEDAGHNNTSRIFTKRGIMIVLMNFNHDYVIKINKYYDYFVVIHVSTIYVFYS
jgi:hypothetical protein